MRPDTGAPSATAVAEFGGLTGCALLERVSSWVGTRLACLPGSSLPTDGAVPPLLERADVCRDDAHLCVALLRASGVPARLVSACAPGLSPMDFHAVCEAAIDRVWCVVAAMALAPGISLVRAATGRDGVDTAFVPVLLGHADLLDMMVSAVVDVLPDDTMMAAAHLGRGS